MPLTDLRKQGKKKFNKPFKSKEEKNVNKKVARKLTEEDNRVAKTLKRKMKITNEQKGDWKKKRKSNNPTSEPIEPATEHTETEPQKKKKKKKPKTSPKKGKAAVVLDSIEEFYSVWEEEASRPSNESFKQPLPPQTEMKGEELNETDYVLSEVGVLEKIRSGDHHNPGSPLLAVISSGALRCLDLRKSLVPNKLGKCLALKMFSKHMKLKDQKKSLASPQVAAVFGTPARVRTLIESGDMKITDDCKLFLDWSFKDIKNRRLCDDAEWKSELFKLLFFLATNGTLKKVYLL